MIGAAEAPVLTGAGQRAASVWTLRGRVLTLIARQELGDVLSGWPLYLAATVAGLAGALLLANTLRSVAASGLEIVARPFYAPLLIALALAALYLAGWAALAIARPREQGALRVLFFAPVDAVSLIAGHALAGLAMGIVYLLLTAPVFLALALLVNLPLPPSLLVGVAVSPVFLLPAIGIGLLISALAPSARSAVFLLAVVLAALLVVEVGYGVLLQVPSTSRYYDALLFLREVLRTVRDGLHWLSPLALLSGGLDAALRSDWPELLRHAAGGLIGGVIWLALAAWALMRRGVLP